MLRQNFGSLVLAVGVVGGVLADVDLTGGAGQPDADLIDGEVTGGVADGTEDAAPVGIASKDSGLNRLEQTTLRLTARAVFRSGAWVTSQVMRWVAPSPSPACSAHMCSAMAVRAADKGIVVGILFADLGVSGQTGSMMIRVSLVEVSRSTLIWL